MILDLNAKIEGYTLSELIYSDKGGYREVYKAWQEDRTPVVLIVYAVDRLPDRDLTLLPDKEFDYHAHLVSEMFPAMACTGECEVQNRGKIRYCVVEHRDALPLEEELTKDRFRVVDAWRVFQDLVIGLHEIAHYGQGACHFNLCPQTAFVCRQEDGTARAVLGGLQFVSRNFTRNPDIDLNLLNPCYRAPESVFEAITPRCMQFSLALLLATMLQGFHPWNVESGMGAFRIFGRMRRNKPRLNLPSDLTRCLGKALETAADNRFDTMDEFVTEVMKLSPFELPSAYTCFDSHHQDPSTGSISNEPILPRSSDAAQENGLDIPVKVGGETASRISVRAASKSGPGFSAVAGMDSLKAALRRDYIDVVNNRELAKQYGIKVPNLLFYGPPGVGKTYIAERLSEELNIDYSLVRPSDLGSIYIHGSQSLIRQLFDKARKQAARNRKGVLLVFDEMDAVCSRRGTDENENLAGEVAEMLTQLNNCVDDQVFCIGTTNCLDRMDKAIIRKGRMDKIIYFDLPDAEAREALFRYELSSRPHVGEIDLNRLSALTDGFTSSDISYVAGECARRAFASTLHDPSHKLVAIEQSLMEKVIAGTRPSVSKQDLKHYELVRDEYAAGNSPERRPIGFVKNRR